jgi:hypothetical protein
MAQKPRGILPDAMTQSDVILIKACSELRPTYEVRVATFMARQTQRRLRIILSGGCTPHASLIAYAQQHGVSLESHS